MTSIGYSFTNKHGKSKIIQVWTEKDDLPPIMDFINESIPEMEYRVDELIKKGRSFEIADSWFPDDYAFRYDRQNQHWNIIV